MEVSLSARHGDLHKDSQEYIERKLPKLSHIFDRLISIQVMVDFQSTEPLVELLVEAEHKHDFVAKESGPSVTAAFDSALDKMEGQLRKYKEKIQDHHRRSLA
ncbi:ribosome-associated translation inhibitor RaiA [bacterium]|jgi:putative sigma-54 modulation protein|nr:ribosome-associated translation inhibitor RaiA [bacterium]